MAYVRERARWLFTVMGRMEVRRGAWQCMECLGARVCPLDLEIGGRNEYTPGVLRMIGVAGASESFAQARRLLSELSGLNMTEKAVERQAEAVGAAVAADEATVVEAAPATAETMYLAVDGTGVPMRREELKARSGKAADGQARTREAKVACIWSEGRAATCSAAIESASTPDPAKERALFWHRVDREAKRCGYDGAQRQVAVGDGARWIWKMVEAMYPNAVQIVDVYHACERLAGAVREAVGDLSGKGRTTFEDLKCKLLKGDVDTVIEDLVAMGADDQIGYFQENRARMDYARFDAEGLEISSGRIESACKTVVGARLKQGGMRWTEIGANAILALRCCILSDRYDGFWTRERQRLKEQLLRLMPDPPTIPAV